MSDTKHTNKHVYEHGNSAHNINRFGQEPAQPYPGLVDKYGNLISNPSPGLSRLETYMLHCIGPCALEGQNGEPFNADAIAERTWYLAKKLLEKHFGE